MDQALRTVFHSLGGSACVRIVGGAVRNHVMGEPIKDIDLATVHEPQKVMDLCEQAGIKTIPTGIEHGTVTAVIEGYSYEITTLRRDVETDGRHARVEFSTLWEEDAQRRDFTMNALYQDEEGQIFDPLGTGLQDAQGRIIKFIGDPNARIVEDALRILRFFRFHAQYNADAYDEAACRACERNASLITELSRERITSELSLLLMAPHALSALSYMDVCCVLPYCLPHAAINPDVVDLIDWQDDADLRCLEARLYTLCPDVTSLSKHLALSKNKRSFKIPVQGKT